MGQRETDTINQMITISNFITHTNCTDSYLDWADLGQFDHINKTKTFKVITLSSFHCNYLTISIYRHRIDEDTEEEPKLPFFIDLFGYQVEKKSSEAQLRCGTSFRSIM